MTGEVLSNEELANWLQAQALTCPVLDPVGQEAAYRFSAAAGRLRASPAVPGGLELAGYRYLYHQPFGGTTWRFETNGREINGGRPIKSEPVYSLTAAPPPPSEDGKCDPHEGCSPDEPNPRCRWPDCSKGQFDAALKATPPRTVAEGEREELAKWCEKQLAFYRDYFPPRFDAADMEKIGRIAAALRSAPASVGEDELRGVIERWRRTEISDAEAMVEVARLQQREGK